MKRGHVPLRTCRGCGARLPRESLRRFVCRDNRLVESMTADGRAVYCCRTEQCWKRLKKNKKAVKQACRLRV